MHGHVIVCGLGQVGYRVVGALLRLGENVTVITLDCREDWRRTVEEAGARVLHGDARDIRQLRAAGVEAAKALIACADQDLVNLEVSLDARRLAPNIRIVARLFDQNLASHLEEGLGIDRALAMSVIAAPAFAAAAFGDEVLGSFSVEDRVFLVGRFIVEQDSHLAGLSPDLIAERHNLSTLLHEPIDGEAGAMICPGDRIKLLGENEAFGDIAPQSYLAVRQVNVPRRGLAAFLHAIDPRHVINFLGVIFRNISVPLRAAFMLLVALTAVSILVFSYGMDLSPLNAFYFVITTVTTTGYGDINLLEAGPVLKLYGSLLMILGSAGTALIYSIITDYIVTNRFQQLAGMQRIPDKEHVIVVGLGNVGFRTVAELERINARVVGIDGDASSVLLGSVRLRTPVVIGDGREADTLRRAGIEKATAVIAVTSSDAVNLSIGLLARRLSPGVRTVIRTFDAGLADKVETTLDIDRAMSASLLAAPSFAAAALHESVVSAFVARDRLFVLCVVEPGAEHAISHRVLFRIGADGRAKAISGSKPPKLVPGERLLVLVEHRLAPELSEA